MKKLVLLVLAALFLIPLTCFGGEKVKAKPAPTVYVCSVCHMKFSASDAKKDHYKDSMDGGVLTLSKPATKKSAPQPMGGMSM